jgi:hypothetical protein
MTIIVALSSLTWILTVSAALAMQDASGAAYSALLALTFAAIMFPIAVVPWRILAVLLTLVWAFAATGMVITIFYSGAFALFQAFTILFFVISFLVVPVWFVFMLGAILDRIINVIRPPRKDARDDTEQVSSR